MKAWLLRKDGKACPVCRVPVNADTLQRFTVTESEAAPARPVNGEPAIQSHRKIEYNRICKYLFYFLRSFLKLKQSLKLPPCSRKSNKWKLSEIMATRFRRYYGIYYISKRMNRVQRVSYSPLGQTPYTVRSPSLCTSSNNP